MRVSVRFTDGIGDIIEQVDDVRLFHQAKVFCVKGTKATVYLPCRNLKSLLVENDNASVEKTEEMGG